MAMMDLLVQVATANKISPGSHIITVGSKDENSVYYKPNTPIGSLDANVIYVIPKPVIDLPIRKMPKLGNQPFEQQTFRLQVNLPRNQRMVLRVSPHSTLAEVKQQICTEKELNHSTHHLVNPAHPETVLDLNSTLEIYGYAEISLMSSSSLRDSIRSTSTNFIAPYQRPEEEKKKKGILGLFARKKKGMSLDASSNGVNSRGVSPVRSEVSVRSSYQPKQSTKRKPAPAPPPPMPAGPSPSPPLVIQCSKGVDLHTESEVSIKTDEIGSNVSHSRHSSDSSGYHEPSVFSDCSENKSPDASVVHGSHVLTAPESPRPKDHREMHLQKKKSSTPVKETTNLNSIVSHSTVSISSTLRKRKAPQPPVPPPLPEAPKESPTSEIALLPAEILAVDPLDNTEVFQNPPSPTMDENSSSQSACEETIIECQPVEIDDAAVCDSATPAIPTLSTATQPCSSSYSEAATTPKDSEGKSAALSEQTTSTYDKSSSPFPEPQDASSSSYDFTEVYTELCSSPKQHDSGSVENVNHIQQPVQEAVEENIVLAEQQEVQKTDKEGLKNLTVTPHSEIEATMAVLDVVIDEQLQNQQSAGDMASPVKSDLLKSEEGEESPLNKPGETESDSGDTHEVPILIHSQVSQEIGADILEQNFTTIADENGHIQMARDVPVNDSKSVSQTKLPNFTLGCYQTINEDIYNSENSGKSLSDILQGKEHNDSSPSSDADVNKNEVTEKLGFPEKPGTLYIQKRKALDVKIMPFKQREEENSDQVVTKGQVQEKRAQFTGLGSHSLGGRSVSLHNLTPKKKVVREIVCPENESVSVVSGMCRAQSDQNVAQENSKVDEKQFAFVQEQKRLYEQYQKLQAQFISWQKQLMNNQSLLQNEQIMPEIVFPPFNDIGNNLQVISKMEKDQIGKAVSTLPRSETSNKINVEELKTRSLPRPKPHPFSLKETSLQSVSPPMNLVKTLETFPKASIPEEPQVVKNKESLENSETVQNYSHKPTQNVISEDRISPDVIYEEVKSQTLPRPKPQTNRAFVESRTMTLNRHTRPKSQVVSVTIGSWQQHNEPVKDIDSSSVASVRSKFQSLENIPQGNCKPGIPAPPEPIKISTSVAPEKKSPASKPQVSDKSADVNMKVLQSVDKEKHLKSIKKSELTRHVPKTEKVSKSETLSQSRYPKPLIKLTSMKDDFHLPSLRTCNKWPLGEMNQKEIAGPDPLRDELKTSAKAPSGAVREKIHRAEVDLRHHSKKDNKISSEVHPRHKEVDLRRVSSKSEPGWTQKKYKESDLRQSKSETIPSDPKCIESCSKSESLPRSEPSSSQTTSKVAAAVRPTKLHITTVSIHNSENAQGTTPPEVKSPQTPKLVYGALKYEGAESKLRTMAELKSVLAQKTAEREDADRRMQTVEPAPSTTPVNSSVPPPPPPPTSAMPVIPPAAPIPVSSQLVMGKQDRNTATMKKESTKQPKMQELQDPREELMLEIRGFGGRQALRKVPVAQASWHLKVFGPATSSLSSS